MTVDESQKGTLLKSERDQSENKVKIVIQEETKEPVIVRQVTRSKPTIKHSKTICVNADVEEINIPNVSIECLNAIELLLKKDPRERITIFDFLQHSWLTEYQRWKEVKKYGRSYSSGSSKDSLK